MLPSCGGSVSLDEIRARQTQGNFGATIEPLREILAERPDDLEVNFLYGRALALTGQPGLSEWSLRKAMQDPRWLVPAAMQLATNAVQREGFDEAVALTGRILEVEPENVSALLLRAKARSLSGAHRDEALGDVEQILALDPDNAAALEPRILVLLSSEREGDAAAAIEELGRRIDEQDLSPEVRGWHCATTALFAYESDEIDLAEERFADCVERFPGHANVVANAVTFYDERRQYDRSYEVLRGALDADPKSRNYRVQLASRTRARGDGAGALAILMEGTQAEDAGAVALAWLDVAKHQQAMGDFAAAADAVSQAMELGDELGGTAPQLMLEYADALLLAGQLDHALAVADEMTVVGHQEMIRARVAQERGEFQQALDHYEKAFQLWPDNPFARYNAALAAEAVGDFDRAIEEYRYSIRIDAAATNARTRIAQLLMAEGRLAEAVTLLRTQAIPYPPELEGQLLVVRLLARMGQPDGVQAQLDGLRSTAPHTLGSGLAAAARGANERGGPKAAMRFLSPPFSRGVDYADPNNTDALRALVVYSRSPGQVGNALELIDHAGANHPRVAAFHEIKGLWLEQSGAPVDRTRAAYRRALELEPENAHALAGLARTLAEEDPEQALSLFERAAAADPSDPEPAAAAAEQLVALDRPSEAEAKLEALLRAFPYEGAVAARIVEIQLARGAVDERSVELARRAARFGGGADAIDLLSRVYASLGDPDRARQTADRAQALRQRLSPAG